jgi:hypothetical protein
MRRSFTNLNSYVKGELLDQLHAVCFDRYAVSFSCAVRLSKWTELITQICAFNAEVDRWDRYPNADESYLVVDIFDIHHPELREARREVLLYSGLREYWALDTVRKDIRTYEVDSAGRIVEKKYGCDAKLPLVCFPDVEIDFRQVFRKAETPLEPE